MVLKKSNNKWLFGVVGGIAEYFKINPDLLRIALILAVVLLDLGVLIAVYIILAIIMPDHKQDDVIEVVVEDDQNGAADTGNGVGTKNNNQYIFGIILVIIGIIALLKEQLRIGWRLMGKYNFAPFREYILPVALIIIGGIILYRSLSNRR